MQSDLYRKQYDFELEQRNSIASATNIPLVAITVVAGAVSAVLLEYRYEQCLTTWAFAISISAALASVCFSVFSIFRSFWNYEYKKLPSSALLKKFQGDLLKWHIENGTNEAEAKKYADDDFLDYLTDRLADATDWNGQNNIVRGNYLHRATAAIALGVAFLLPAALLYAYSKATAEEEIHQVHLIGPSTTAPEEINMSSTKPPASSHQPASAPAPAPASAPVPSAKPLGPPNTLFKGNTDLVKPSAKTSLPKK
ncbi:MAG TPA: hypothetical protein PKV56_14815 [Burkholderiaceae bacterium]|nr:hypothetical protein [Burkholderiaceae bacterium]